MMIVLVTVKIRFPVEPRPDFLPGWLKGGVPYPADHEKHDWEKQKVQPNKRTIMIKMPDGKDKISPRYHDMQQFSTSAETAKQNKAAASAKISEKQIGHDQKHAVEGESIYLLLEFIISVVPSFLNEWEVDYAFDGLQPDWFIRKNTWPADQYVAIQQKSAQINFGKHTDYSLTKQKYDSRIYCIAVGMLDYKRNR